MSTPTVRPRVIIVSCGGRKNSSEQLLPAGERYTGSYHLALRRAADSLTHDGQTCRVLILSALYGLLELHDPIAAYDMRLGDEGSVSGERLRQQAADMGILGADVTVLGPRAYVEASRTVWPELTAPLAGARGIGDQLAKLADIYDPGRHSPAPQPLPARQRARLPEASSRRSSAQRTHDRTRKRYEQPASERATPPIPSSLSRTRSGPTGASRFPATTPRAPRASGPPAASPAFTASRSMRGPATPAPCMCRARPGTLHVSCLPSHGFSSEPRFEAPKSLACTDAGNATPTPALTWTACHQANAGHTPAPSGPPRFRW